MAGKYHPQMVGMAVYHITQMRTMVLEYVPTFTRTIYHLCLHIPAPWFAYFRTKY